MISLNDRTKLHLLSGVVVLFTALAVPSTGLADTPNDIRPGMPIEDATRIAIRCIQAASRMKTRDIRLQDTLGFVGINDEMRVDALRRHIVRNPNIGVPSVTTGFLGKEFHYLILNEQLSDIDSKSTVAKLAQTISSKAGIPRLTYGRVAQMIALCRKSATDLPTTTEVRMDTGRPENFADCLAGIDKDKDKKKVDEVTFVIASVSDPTGDEYRYWINKTWLDGRIAEGSTYAGLINSIADTTCARRHANARCIEETEGERIKRVLQSQAQKEKNRRVIKEEK